MQDKKTTENACADATPQPLIKDYWFQKQLKSSFQQWICLVFKVEMFVGYAEVHV